MKKIKKKYEPAVQYKKEHPEISYTKVADMFGCDRKTLKRYEEQVKFENFQYETEDEYIFFEENELQAIEAYISTDKSIIEISSQFNVSQTSLSRWVKMLDVQREHPQEKRVFNRNAFANIETEEDAYWLGFLVADGYVNEDRGFLNVKLQQKDEDHLKKLVQYMQGQNVEIKNDKGGSGQIIKSVTFNSRQVVNNLVALNVRQGKSGKEKVSLLENKELYRHYIRGLIDGDGSLSHGSDYHIDYVGSEEMVTFVRDYISENVIPLECNYIYSHGTIYRFTCRRHDVAQACYKYFYENASIYLERKYAFAMEHIKHGRE